MKRLLTVILALFCLLALTACAGQAVLDDIARQVAEDGAEPATDTDAGQPEAAPAAEQEPEEASDTDAEAPAETPGEAPALPEEPSHGGFETLSAAECVADNDGLPLITLDCPGAAEINDEIESGFRYLTYTDYAHVRYEVFKSDSTSVLSIVLIEDYETDSRYYTPFNLDLVTGERMDGEALLRFLGLDTEDVTEAELTVMGTEFEQTYGSMAEDARDFWQDQYDRTVSPDNAETERLWLGDGGVLYFAAKIYSLAGAEYYESPMAMGYAFP